MASIEQKSELTTAEKQILRTPVPDWSDRDGPRICFLQLRGVETANEEVADRIKALDDATNWELEFYDEVDPGTRPDGVDPKASVRKCGIGGCTLRVFQAENGSDIQTGACKAASYCLKERFEAVSQTETVEEGKALYRDVLDTCNEIVSSASAGNYCPRLNCDVSAGLSIDMIPGTAGTCSVGN